MFSEYSSRTKKLSIMAVCNVIKPISFENDSREESNDILDGSYSQVGLSDSRIEIIFSEFRSAVKFESCQ